jgi:cytochrome oxidase Cu insertion factor (SCO1/SenC/PrrC family)
MRPRSLFAAAVLLGGVSLPLTAQAPLGPIDGRNLPPVAIERVGVGSMAPDFTLEVYRGDRFTLSQFRGSKNLVLVFYRGWW